MAKIRTIKPSIATHEGLFEAEKESGLPIRLAFSFLLMCADREGRFKWRPRELKLSVFPYDDHINFEDVLNCLVKYGFILKYEVKSEKYGCYINWEKHQKPNNKEPQSSIPSPEEGTILEIPQESLKSPQAFLELTRADMDMDMDMEVDMEVEEGNGRGSVKGKLISPAAIVSQAAPAQPRSVSKTAPEIKTVFDHWCQVMGSSKSHLNDERKRVIKRALGWGYTTDQLCEAVTGCSLTPFNMGDNDNGQRYNGLKVIFKNSDNVERFMSNARSPPRPRNKTEKIFDQNLSVAKSWAHRKKEEMKSGR